MGSRSDNGGSWPPDGGSPDGLPDLPPEWGDIVVPDDLSALADEVAAVRAELDGRHHRNRRQRFSARPGIRRLRRIGKAALRAPVLIVTIAILVTMASVFASTWPGPTRPPTGQRTANTTDDGPETLPALELVGTDGQAVALRGQLPAVIVLVDGCDCARLVADTAAAAPAGTTVLTVLSGTATSRPTPPPADVPPADVLPADVPPAAAPSAAVPAAPDRPVLQLRDPAGGLRSAYGFAAPDGTAGVLLVDRAGKIVRRVYRTASVDLFRPDLARL